MLKCVEQPMWLREIILLPTMFRILKRGNLFQCNRTAQKFIMCSDGQLHTNHAVIMPAKQGIWAFYSIAAMVIDCSEQHWDTSLLHPAPNSTRSAGRCTELGCLAGTEPMTCLENNKLRMCWKILFLLIFLLKFAAFLSQFSALYQKRQIKV